MTDKEREAWQKEQALRAAQRAVNMEGLPPGHPIQLLRRENGALFSLIEELEGEENVARLLPRLTEIRRHYAKTEELLMPLLYRYGVTGPSKAIWDADDEAKQMLSALLRRTGTGEELPREEVAALFACLRDVATREEKVLFPLTLRYFTEDEWKRVYHDLPEIGCAFIDEKDAPRWDEGEAFCRMEDEKDKTRLLSESKIELPTGTLTVAQLAGILSLLPVDITFIDADDRLRFFVNEGRVFARPRSALGREIWDCHPPRLVPMIRQMIDDFRQKSKKEMTVWRRITGKPVCVRCLAVYDVNGDYLGTLETVQDFTEAETHFCKAKA